MFRRSFGLVLLLGALALAGAQEQERDDTQDTRQETTLIMLGDSEYGSHLVDGSGKPVYLFLPDNQAEPTCEDACLEAWPPVILRGELGAGDGADVTLLSSIEREDGSRQVTYNGWPLYYFYLDVPNEAGMMVTLGQAQEGRWYLVTAEGEALDAEEYAR